MWVKVRRASGARAACSARDIRRAFSHALPVRAVDGRVHAYTDRERDTAGGGGVATRLQRQSVIVEHCTTVGELIVIEARRSVQCVVRGFLETSAHKSHRYISRYPEIFEKKSRLIVRKIR